MSMKYPDMEERIEEVHKQFAEFNLLVAAEEWLKIWSEIKEIIKEEEIENPFELDDLFDWNMFAYNLIQDMEELLRHAGYNDKRFWRERIAYCQDILTVFTWEDKNELIWGNMRATIADTHFLLGEKEKSDALFREYLAEDPNWVWGYIYWARLYLGDRHQPGTDVEFAAEIMKMLPPDAMPDITDDDPDLLPMFLEAKEEILSELRAINNELI